VLGSILGALKAIVNVIGMEKMTPPIKDLLPRLTPILKNRHEKVQENCIDLVGRIADRGAEYVGLKEWMRICFELLEMLKAHKKGIRRATVNTFGYIAKAIGPSDVLATLLNNLKVQERQNRVCTTVAIAIVAETCSPFTVLPALMNEYRVPELNVQVRHAPRCPPPPSHPVAHGCLAVRRRTVCSRRCPSSSSTSVKWARTTATPWRRCSRTRSWTATLFTARRQRPSSSVSATAGTASASGAHAGAHAHRHVAGLPRSEPRGHHAAPHELHLAQHP
jgi:hypothetical protein